MDRGGKSGGRRSGNTEVLCWVLCVLFGGILLPDATASAEHQQQKRVLILYSFDAEVGLFSEFDDGLRTTLKSGQIGRFNFYTEFLDLARITTPRHEKVLQAYLRGKYSTEKVDLIIPVSMPAINFILSHGNDLFPGVPVVFCTFSRLWIGSRPLPANATGLVATTKINRTLAAALKLQPDTRHVVVVGGTLPYERDWMKEIQNDLKEYAKKLDFTYYTEWPMDGLLKKLANLPEHTIVLYMMMWRDGAGEYYLPAEALSVIAQSSNAPVYSVFDKYLGSGIVGGDLVPLRTAGAAAGEMGLQVLSGESPAAIPVQSVDDARYIFDWRQLQRWRISEERLPPGSVVVFKQATFWNVHKWLIVEMILLIAVETILILLLLFQRRKRKLAEADLRNSEARYTSFLALSSEGIARFEFNQPMPLRLSEADQVEYMLEHLHLAECNGPFAHRHGMALPQYLVGNKLADLLFRAAQHADFLHAFVRSEYRLLDYVTHTGDPQGRLRWFENRVTGILEQGHLARVWLVQREISDRKQAEDAFREEARFNELMNSVLRRFASCAPSEVDASVEKALEETAKFIGADHALVIEFFVDRGCWGATHEWCGPNVTSRIQEYRCMPMGTIPRNEQLLLKGGIVRINSLDDYPREAVEERQLMKDEGHLSTLTVPIRTKAGIYSAIGLHSHARPITWKDNAVPCLQMVGDAVATALARKRSIQELRKSEEKFSAAFHSSRVAKAILSLDAGRYVEVNEAYEKNTGYSAGEIIGHTPGELGLYAGSKGNRLMYQATAAQPGMQREEIQFRTKAGEFRVALVSTANVEMGGELCMLLESEDVTEGKRAEKSLREMGARMLMVQEEERRRVARELHDDFSQRLALLAIDLEQLTQQPPATRQDGDSRIRAMWLQTQELTSDIHRLSHWLHPSKLEDLGLTTAIRSYCNELSRQKILRVEFSEQKVPRPLPREIALCLYRVVQEALRNVIKHSGSKTAVVELKVESGEILLRISDSGKGFDGAAAKHNKGLGLIGMHERALAVGGDISIWSQPGKGTRVEARIPLPSRQLAESSAASTGAEV